MHSAESFSTVNGTVDYEDMPATKAGKIIGFSLWHSKADNSLCFFLATNAPEIYHF